jgi:hypothetical protein
MVYSGDRLSEPGLVFEDGLFAEEMDGKDADIAVTVTKLKDNFLVHVGFQCSKLCELAAQWLIRDSRQRWRSPRRDGLDSKLDQQKREELPNGRLPRMSCGKSEKLLDRIFFV